VQNTAFVAGTDPAQKYVTAIGLESPFLSPGSRVVEFPVGVTLNSLNLTGVVTYSDGSTKRLPVDGTRFAVAGLEQFTASGAGMDVPVLLTYYLSPGEVNYNAQAGSTKHITEVYSARTLARDGAYQVCLYAYPQWVDATSGYQLRWWLYSLERDSRYDVTSLVHLAPNSAAFNGTNYTSKQTLTVTVNLKDVDPSFVAYVHVQTLEVTLRQPGTARTTNWTVSPTVGQSVAYGDNVHATMFNLGTNQWSVRVGSGLLTQTDWLAALYSKSLPQYDPQREIAPPAPTHFALVAGTSRVVYPLSSWNAALVTNAVLNNSGTVYVQFIQRLGETDLQLGVAGLPLYRVDGAGTYI
jgi:hypothetical protein